VTATNSAGKTSVDSNGTAVVTASSGGGGSGPPVNTVLPQITGNPVQGQVLVTTNGTWNGAATITFTYQWLRCDTNGNACSAIFGETKNNRTLSDGDVGHTIRVQVTGRNGVGSSTVQSAQTAVVTGSGGGGGGGPLPDGAIKLPSGKYSIPVTSVSLPAQLFVDKVKFLPNPIASRTEPIVVKVHVVDSRGYVVRDASVQALGLPYGWIAKPRAVTTNENGIAVVRFVPTRKLPLRKGETLAVYVKAWKPGESALAGISARRLVQVALAPPRRR